MAQLSMNQRVSQFKAYYQLANERKLLGFFLGSEFPLQRYPESVNLPSDRPLVPEDFNENGYASDCKRLFEAHEACGGDFIWGGSAFWGIPWLEAAIGLPIIADHATGSIHSQKTADVIKLISHLDPSVKNPWICKLVCFLQALKREGKGRWPVGITRMRGISDLLSALYGNQEFLFMMMEEPEEIKMVCKALTEYWISIARIQLDNIDIFYGGIGSFYYNLWTPPDTVWLQEDAASLLSPVLYNEFIQPCDAKIVEAFKGCIVHQHPAGFVPTDAYITMGMLAIELHVDDGGPRAKALHDWYMKILQHKPLLIWGKLTAEDMDWIFSKLPDKGVAIQVVVGSPEEAASLYDTYVVRQYGGG